MTSRFSDIYPTHRHTPVFQLLQQGKTFTLQKHRSLTGLHPGYRSGTKQFHNYYLRYYFFICIFWRCIFTSLHSRCNSPDRDELRKHPQKHFFFFTELLSAVFLQRGRKFPLTPSQIPCSSKITVHQSPKKKNLHRLQNLITISLWLTLTLKKSIVHTTATRFDYLSPRNAK